YQAESVTLIQDLNQVARSSDLISTLSQPPSALSKQHLKDVLAHVPAQYHVFLVTLDVVAKDHHIVGELEDVQTSMYSPVAVDTHIMLYHDTVPIIVRANTPICVLTTKQANDDDFALSLEQKTGFKVVLCQGTHILGSSMRESSLNQFLSGNALCTTDKVNVIDGPQHFLALANSAQTTNQLMSSPSLVMLDVERLYTLNAHTGRYVQLLLASGIFVFALGVIAYTIITRIF